MSFFISTGFVNNFVSLLFPNVCAACHTPLVKGEEYICMKCLYAIPKTHFYKHTENYLTQLFWGRCPVEFAASYFYYRRESDFKNLIHKFKYKGKTEIGYALGKHFGITLSETVHFRQVETIIPVPLHPKKLKKRGFNQSEIIARGINECLQKDVDTKTLQRNIYTTSQTRKGRFARWKNVEDIFLVTKPKRITGKHILLVDDVITTGATIEACTNALLKVPGTKVSVVSLGVTQQ